MSNATVRSGFDAYIEAAKPTSVRPPVKYLPLRASGGAARAYLYFKIPAPRGATIVSATLRLFAAYDSTGSRTMTVKQVTTYWKTSTLTWNGRPAVTDTGAASKAIGTVPNRTPLDFDVTAQVQAMVNGAPNYGFEIYSTATTATHYVYGLRSSGSWQPYLTVEWSDAPAAPTTLNPSDGTVSVPKPIVQFDYTDVSGNTSLKSVQVQIDPAADGTSPDFDSGAVDSVAPQLDLSTTAFAGLSAGVPTQWRVRVQDGAGIWSGWSDWTGIVYTVQGAVTIANPAGGVVYETTPPIVWTFADQTSYEVIIYDAVTGKVLHDSGPRPGADASYGLPAGVLTDGRTYSVEVRCVDDEPNRVATPGSPAYSSATATFVVEDDPSVDGVDTFTTTTDGVSPAVTFEWTRSTAPDSWTFYEDGKPIAADVSPGLTLVSGTTYQYVYYGARPDHEHVYSVRAVVNGAMSPAGITDSVTTSPSGLWLIDPDDGLSVVLWGDDEGTWNMVDDASVYAPVGSTEVVRIVSGMRGLDGSLAGLIMDGFGKTYSEHETSLYALKSRPTARLRLVASDENLEVEVGNIRPAPKPITRNGRIQKSVTFDFWQVGDLPFDPNI